MSAALVFVRHCCPVGVHADWQRNAARPGPCQRASAADGATAHQRSHLRRRRPFDALLYHLSLSMVPLPPGWRAGTLLACVIPPPPERSLPSSSVRLRASCLYTAQGPHPRLSPADGTAGASSSASIRVDDGSADARRSECRTAECLSPGTSERGAPRWGDCKRPQGLLRQ